MCLGRINPLYRIIFVSCVSRSDHRKSKRNERYLALLTLPIFVTSPPFPIKKSTLPPPHKSLIPLRFRIELNQTMGSNQIPLPQQLRNINVQWTLWLRTRQQLMYTRHGSRDGVGRRPRGLQQIETDLASLEVDVWMADFGDEFYGRRDEGVCGGNGDVEEPATA